MAVAVHCHPQRAFELAAYASIIANLAHDGWGMAWARYNRTFCQVAAVNPQLPWSRREQERAGHLAHGSPQHQPHWAPQPPSALQRPVATQTWADARTPTVVMVTPVSCCDSTHTARDCPLGGTSQLLRWSTACNPTDKP